MENTVATVEIDPCADPRAAKGLVRERVLDGALAIMHRQDPASFGDLPPVEPGSGCIEDDGSAALSGEQLSELMTGAGRGPLRRLAESADSGAARGIRAAGGPGPDQCRHGQGHQSDARPAVWTAEAVGSLLQPGALLPGLGAGAFGAGNAKLTFSCFSSKSLVRSLLR